MTMFQRVVCGGFLVTSIAIGQLILAKEESRDYARAGLYAIPQLAIRQ